MLPDSVVTVLMLDCVYCCLPVRQIMTCMLQVPGFLEELVSQALQDVVALSTDTPPSRGRLPYQFLEVLPSAAAQRGVQLVPCPHFLQDRGCKYGWKCFKSHLLVDY